MEDCEERLKKIGIKSIPKVDITTSDSNLKQNITDFKDYYNKIRECFKNNNQINSEDYNEHIDTFNNNLKELEKIINNPSSYIQGKNLLVTKNELIENINKSVRKLFNILIPLELKTGNKNEAFNNTDNKKVDEANDKTVSHDSIQVELPKDCDYSKLLSDPEDNNLDRYYNETLKNIIDNCLEILDEEQLGYIKDKYKRKTETSNGNLLTKTKILKANIQIIRNEIIKKLKDKSSSILADIRSSADINSEQIKDMKNILENINEPSNTRKDLVSAKENIAKAAEAAAAKAKARAEAKYAEKKRIIKLLKILEKIHSNYDICASEENDSEDEFKTVLKNIMQENNRGKNPQENNRGKNPKKNQLEENLAEIRNNSKAARLMLNKSVLNENLKKLKLKKEFKDLLEPLIKNITNDSSDSLRRRYDIDKWLDVAEKNVKYYIIMHSIPKCINKVNNIINTLIESMDKDTSTESLEQLKGYLKKLQDLYNETTSTSPQSGGQDNNTQSTEENIQNKAQGKIEELEELIETYNGLIGKITELSKQIKDNNITDLRTELKNKTEQMKDVEEELAKLTSIESLKQQLENKTGDISNVEKLIESLNKNLNEKTEQMKNVEKDLARLTEDTTNLQSKLGDEEKVKRITDLLKKISAKLKDFKSDKYEELYTSTTGLTVDKELHESVQEVLTEFETKEDLFGINKLKDEDLKNHLVKLNGYTNELGETLLTEQLLKIQVRVNGVKYIAKLLKDNNNIYEDLDKILENIDNLYKDIENKVQKSITGKYTELKEKATNYKTGYYPAIKQARKNYEKFNNIKNDTDIKIKKLRDKFNYLKEYLYDTKTSGSIKDIKESIDKINKSIKELIDGNESNKNGGSGDEEPKNSLNEINTKLETLNKIKTDIYKKYETAEEAKTKADDLDKKKQEEMQEHKKDLGVADRFKEGLKSFFNIQKGGYKDDNKTLDELNSLNKKVNESYNELLKEHKEFNETYNEIKDSINTLEKDRFLKIGESLKKVDNFFRSLEDLMFKYKPLRYEFYRLMNEDEKTREHFRALRKALVILNKKQKQEQVEDKRLSLTILQILNSSPNIDKAIERINANMNNIVKIEPKPNKGGGSVENNDNNKIEGGGMEDYLPFFVKREDRSDKDKKDKKDDNNKEIEESLKKIPIPKTFDDMRYMLKELSSRYNTYNATVKDTTEIKGDAKFVKNIENQEKYILKMVENIIKGLIVIKDKNTTEFDDLKDNKYISMELDKYKESADKIREDLLELTEKINKDFIKYINLKYGHKSSTQQYKTKDEDEDKDNNSGGTKGGNPKSETDIKNEGDAESTESTESETDIENEGDAESTESTESETDIENEGDAESTESETDITGDIKNINKKLEELKQTYQNILKRKDRIEDPVKYASLEYGNENIFNKLYNNYSDKKDENPEQAIDELVVRMDNNNLIPSKVLSVDLRDKIVFIFATLFIRLFSLSVVESLIEKGVIRNSKFSIVGYLGLFSILLLAFTLFVNLDMYRMRIVFNYVNFHSNGTNMLAYVLMLWVFGGIVYYITYQINKDLPEKNNTDLGKLRLIYRIQIISLITWVFLSLIVLIL